MIDIQPKFLFPPRNEDGEPGRKDGGLAFHNILRCIKIAALVLFLPFLLFVPSLFTSWGGVGSDLNEPVQDYVECGFGIDTLDRRAWIPGIWELGPGGFQVIYNLQPYPRDSDIIIPFGPHKEVYFRKSRERSAHPYLPPFFLVDWSDRIYFSNANGFRDMAHDSVRTPDIILTIWFLFSVCLGLFTLSAVLVYVFRRDHFRGSAIRSLIAVGVLGAWCWGWWIGGRGGDIFPRLRGYADSHAELYDLCRRHRSEFDRLLESDASAQLVRMNFLPLPQPLPDNFPPGVTFHSSYDPDLLKQCLAALKIPFYPADRGKENLHHGYVFTGRKPLEPAGYVRINADLFTYLFYAPQWDGKTGSRMNPQMEWRKLDDGFWLGRYSTHIDNMNRMMKLQWIYFFFWLCCIALLVWLLCRHRPSSPKDGAPPVSGPVAN